LGPKGRDPVTGPAVCVPHSRPSVPQKRPNAQGMVARILVSNACEAKREVT